MTHASSRHLLPFLAILVIASLVPGCGSDPAQPVTPGVEPEVVNEVDVFQFQVSSIDGYTGTLNYTWSNTGTLANIDQSAAVTSGQAVLSLLDSNGVLVYSEDLSVDGSYASAAGVAGDWSIRVEFTQMQGTLNFRTEKRTP